MTSNKLNDNLMKTQLLTVLMLFVYQSMVFAQTTIYASPTGIASNAGTEESPKDIKAAFNSNLGPNSTIILLDGTYTISDDLYLWQKQGSASGYITIKAKNKHMAILKGSTAKITDYYAVLYLSTCKYVIVDGLTVMNETNSLDIAAGIRLGDACDFVTVKNCRVYGHGAGGITCEGGDNVTIEDNIVYNNCTRNETNTSGISFYKLKPRTSTTNFFGAVIRRNIVYGNKCEIPYRYGDQSNVNPTDGNGIVLDVLDDPFASGGADPYGKRVLIENNLVYDNGASGIKCFNSSLARIVNNTVYHNNTVQNRYSIHSNQIWVFESRGVNGVYHEGIYNNLVVADNNLTDFVDQAIAVDFDLNKIYNNHLVGAGVKHTNYSYSTAAFPTAANTIVPITNQDYPKFQNVTYKNFKLKNNSPLLEKYTEAYGPTTDLIGTLRPQGTATDIGCYEYIYVTGVKLRTTTATIAVGATVTLTPTLLPRTASYKSVTWASSNTSVATVSRTGVVKGIGSGTSIITVLTVDGARAAKCTVTVTGTSTRVEAENETLSGTVAYMDNNATISAFSGTGYVGSFDNTENTDKLTMTIAAPTTGSYTLRIRYAACAITNNYVKVNSNAEVNTSFTTTGCSTWGNKDQTVSLNAGNNTVVIRKNNGAIDIDYIELVTNASTSRQSATPIDQTSSYTAAVDEGIKLQSAYPNPFNNILSIPTLENTASTMQVRLLTLTGKPVNTQSILLYPGQTEARIYVNGIATGLYILEVRQGGLIKTEKVFKQ
jgi:uncharacterized protein YjdB